MHISGAYAHVSHGAQAVPARDQTVKQAAEEAEISKTAAVDAFVHAAVSAEETEYIGTTYTKEGATEGLPSRPLPDRYYEQLSTPRIGYKGTMVSYVELLEEAVTTGVIELNENERVFDNFERAEQALIWSKAKPLYPWSSSLYTEDGQYKLRVENGQVTGARIAYYTDVNGRKITTQYLAEQLANGVLPIDLDGDYSFLHDVDPDLYFKALDIGTAKRKLEESLNQFEQGEITQKQFEDDIGPLILLLFGKEGSKLALARLKEILADEQFGGHILQSLGTADYPIPDKTTAAE